MTKDNLLLFTRHDEMNATDIGAIAVRQLKESGLNNDWTIFCFIASGSRKKIHTRILKNTNIVRRKVALVTRV